MTFTSVQLKVVETIEDEERGLGRPSLSHLQVKKAVVAFERSHSRPLHHVAFDGGRLSGNPVAGFSL